ncbi:restriction endonuclease subunit S [Microbulbifer sp. MCCC 1A16149]|uniref:restriction endonuclease subunit S n=1 Tax=Microbulbifer sp. MCCC 1A16149 TaxID=3411322 RepID=UPI003D0A2A76
MAPDWVQLKEIVKIKGGKRLPKGESLQSEPNSHPYIRVRDMGEKYLPREGLEFVPDSVFPKIKNYIVNENDVIISIVGTVGLVAVIDSYFDTASQTENCAKLSGLDAIDAQYLYYCLVSPLGQREISVQTVGAVQPKLPLYGIENISVPWPIKSIREQIVRYLGRLDDKIELNRQINSTLESMAQALFKSWFVDFDPVIDNALAAGNPIPDALQARARGRQELRTAASASAHRLPVEIQQLFPSRFVFTEEMGWVPEGWGVVSLRSLTSKIGSGSTPRGGSQVYLEDGVSLIRSQNVYDSEFTWDGLAHINDEAAKQLKGVTLEEGDVLLNITGASILRTCIVPPDVLPARVNQHVAIVRPIAGVPSKYLHLHLLNEKTKSYLMGQNAGASREAVTKGHIESVPTLNPGKKILFQFEKIVSPFIGSTTVRNSNIVALTVLRDSLLPKLLSGKIQVSEAEQQLAEVI